MRQTERCEFLVDVIDLEQATGVPGARWEHFQLAHLCDDSTFRIEDKSRQIAWSWLTAAEAVAEALLYERDSIFVSINQDEAKEKIRYARQIFDAMRPDIRGRVKLIRDNELGIEFASGARLSSLPARPPRGRARSNIYLDEFAHVQRDKQIYTAALPILSKGGRLRIGSSPMGASGTFWEVFSQGLRSYPDYKRKATPWWETYAFCTNPVEARKVAPGLPTAERVARYGNDRIKTIYANMVDEDFRQEFEGDFVDETTAWITWDEIKANQDDELVCVQASCYGKAIDKALQATEEVARLIRAGLIEAVLVSGVDIGRTRNTTEVFAVGLSTVGNYPLRLAITLDNCEYDDQIEVMERVLSVLPVRSMLIDQNGIGNQLAEHLGKRYPGKAEGVLFTNASKGLWATDTKMLVQQHKTPIPIDRDLAYQVHSIKKLVTASKNLVFDTDTNEKHHADKFWAWALALAAAKSGLATIQRGTVPRSLADYAGLNA
jgi:phage FluMu gp28-like protein